MSLESRFKRLVLVFAQGNTRGIGVAAELNEVLLAGFDGGMYIVALYLARRGRPLRSALSKYNSWAVIGCLKPRGHNANHSFVPVRRTHHS